MDIQTTKGQWFKLTEAAQLLGVSEITVRRKAKTGQLKAILRNGKYLVHLEENAELGLYVGPEDLSVASTLQMSNGRKQQFAQIARKEISEPQIHREDLVQSLKRTIEDQQTLIASLEDSIARLSRKLSSEQNSKK